MAAERLVAEFIEHNSELASTAEDLMAACNLLVRTFEQGGKLLVCGNGGSAADSGHIVGELMKSFRLPRPLLPQQREQLAKAPSGAILTEKLERGLPAIDLTAQGALLTAIANDIAPEIIFAQQVFALGRKGDVLLGLTTSGKSANVVLALETAQALGLSTISFVGEEGKEAQRASEICIKVPARETYKVQQYHLCLYHILCAIVEEACFGKADL